MFLDLFRDYLKISITISYVFECGTTVILLVFTTIAYLQMIKNDINSTSGQCLDDVLLLITIPAFFINCIFTLVPAFKHKSILQICISMLRVIEVLIQTPFIIDGKRRCLNFKQDKEYGRKIVMFLAIANMSLWIYYTSAVKTLEKGDEW